jgi:hypothetical protein
MIPMFIEAAHSGAIITREMNGMATGQFSLFFELWASLIKPCTASCGGAVQKWLPDANIHRPAGSGGPVSVSRIKTEYL